MKQRILPPEEWHRLEGTEAGDVWQTFDPEQTRVIVVEEDGKIIGTWTVMRTVHVECLWAAPEYRGSFGLARRLLAGMREIASGWGARNVFTGSMSPHVTDLIRRFGGIPAPCEYFILPLEMASSGRREDRERGRAFHAQLSAQVRDDIHPEDSQHDERVGKALRTAVGGDPVRAESEYNAWAKGAGYAPVRFLGAADGKLTADIGTAVIEVDKEFRVHVMEEKCR